MRYIYTYLDKTDKEESYLYVYQDDFQSGFRVAVSTESAKETLAIVKHAFKFLGYCPVDDIVAKHRVLAWDEEEE